MMKRCLQLSVGLALICSLAIVASACGGGGGSTSEETSSTTKPAEVAGKITVWDFNAGSFPKYGPTTKDLIAEFERLNPDVTVDFVEQPYASFERIYQAAFTAREGPDVMTMENSEQGVLSYVDGLEVLNDRIHPELQEQITNWVSVTPGFTESGDHYGVPIGLNSLTFYYNKKLFARAGLPREFEPKTWDEVREAGEKLKAAGIQPFAGGNKEGYENVWWSALAWPTIEGSKEEIQQKAVELLEGELPWTDEAITEMFEPLFMMQEAGLYPADRFTTPLIPDGTARFGEEEGAMVVGLSGTIAYYGEYNPKLGEKNVGMFLPPGSKFRPTGAEVVWSIPKFAKNKDAAWAFIEFMSSAKGLGKYVEDGIFLPNRKDVPLPPDAPEQAHQIVEWVSELGSFPGSWVPASVVFGPMLQDVNEALQGRSTLADAQEAIQETVEKTATR
jgi:ABC-type glycerol-3-phosphate transport system substrate-binding protein